MKISDIMKDDGLYGILAEDDEDGGKKKRKKSKDKKRDKDVSSEYKHRNAELKEMSKGELRLRCQEYGIKGSEADFDSKKSMRHAILKAMGLRKHGSDGYEQSLIRGSGSVLASPSTATGPVGLTAQPVKEEIVKDRPPYYYDEDNGDFVFTRARDQSALTCLDGFMAMGHIRKQADPADGFAELTERIYAKIQEPQVPALEKAEETIPVTDFKVIEEDAPAELSAEDAAKLTAKVDDMLKGATTARKKREKAPKE